MTRQCTLENTICATGVGLHTGQKVNLLLRPADPNTGIVFRRIDFEEPVEILAAVENIVDSTMSTVLGKGKVTVSNVEPLLAAFAGMGIDNAFVDVNAAEVPAMDGSAGPFVFLIQSAGIKAQDALRQYIRIKKTVSLGEGEERGQLSPCNEYKLTYLRTYHSSSQGSNSKKIQIILSPVIFQREISRARSFSFARDEEMLQNKTQSNNGRRDKVVSNDDYRVQDANGLRYADEFLRHQLLNTIGQLYIIGHRLLGEYIGHQMSHKMNTDLLRALLEDDSAWELVPADTQSDVPDSSRRAVVAL
ncbi:MAG: UDP-3-O-acyl-N-acetylglucosamine deacetylase [Gammaproteobacteria bacterium]|nr:UDP-3-O-acyl-N-acetylglucosamine deacetylase [Gammaproteobacteria bacterium]